MQNVEVHAGSPGYLNLMTTQERLATLLVRVSYPGDLGTCGGTRKPRLMHYAKSDVVADSILKGKPCIFRWSLGENEKVAGFSS